MPSDRILLWLISRIGRQAFRTQGYNTPNPTREDLAPLTAGFTDDLPEAPQLGWQDFQRSVDQPATGI